MVYVTDTYSSQFRIAINVNYIWDFLSQKEYKDYRQLPVAQIAESVEDELNLVDILHKTRLCVHDIVRKHIAKAYNEKRRS